MKIEIGESKFEIGASKMLVLIVFLAFLVLHLCNTAHAQTIASSSNEPKLFIDGCKIKSLIFSTSVEVRVDSLIIPAGTVGKLRELSPNEKGGINMFVFDFQSKNGTEVSFRFIRKELVEKRPINNPTSFILNGQAEFYEGKKYRAQKTLKPLSVERGKECVLFVKK